MHPYLRRATALAATGLLVLGLGCGEGKPSVETSTTEATVKGTVKLRGKLVTRGEISFDPSNYQRKNETARRVPIGKDGSYTVKTLVGANRVSFAVPAMARDPLLQDLSLQYDVQAGDNNTYHIELPPPPPGP